MFQDIRFNSETKKPKDIANEDILLAKKIIESLPDKLLGAAKVGKTNLWVMKEVEKMPNDVVQLVKEWLTKEKISWEYFRYESKPGEGYMEDYEMWSVDPELSNALLAVW